MTRFQFLWFFCISFVLFSTILKGKVSATNEERKVYIVYLGALPKREYSPTEHHASILKEVVDSNFLEQSLVRSYTRSFNAFAVNLTEQEREMLAAHDDVVSMFPSRMLQLLTTESWDFMGFSENANRNPTIESDIIIGVIDTGIWPESESFNDQGLCPPPKKWKGVCEGGKNFTCNNKIIGARHYDVDDSARDIVGHGSHTASTAAGNNVRNVSFYGIAQGTARGGIPSARIAVYKVCTSQGCSDHDILAAFNDAIADGVDLITISLGGSSPINLQFDSIAIGALHAVEKGILTVNAAGNNGISPGQTASVAPWLFSVAASTTKRHIISKIVLGNGKEIDGNSVNSFKLNGTNFPLVYGEEVSKDCPDYMAKGCWNGCLDSDKVKGKIVLCGTSSGKEEASVAGALGSIILTDDKVNDVSDVVPLAASVLSKSQFAQVEIYYNSTNNPQASIFTSQPVENRVAPIVASFSSRGPNLLFPDILKPDITAPGVDILAAYSPTASPSTYTTDTRSVKYDILSGTSMACPHVAGAAAYVKSQHPDWSPSAIKSALMTTAWPLNASNTRYGDAEFSYGAGHIDPLKALQPGLVYETPKGDYAKLLRSLNFDDSTLAKIFGENPTCSNLTSLSKPKDMNYPTMTAKVDQNQEFSIQFPRTVTNVGLANSTYRATITSTPQECNITVNPSILSFTSLMEMKSFVLTVTGKIPNITISASLEWSDGVHSVRSPIVVY